MENHRRVLFSRSSHADLDPLLTWPSANIESTQIYQTHLTHWGLNNMVDILQTTFRIQMQFNYIFSCDQAALWMVQSVCLSVCSYESYVMRSFVSTKWHCEFFSTLWVQFSTLWVRTHNVNGQFRYNLTFWVFFNFGRKKYSQWLSVDRRLSAKHRSQV